MRRVLLRVALAVVVIGVALFAVHVLGGFDTLGSIRDAVLQMRTLDVRFLLIAVALDLLSLLLNGAMWTRLLRAVGHPLPLRVGMTAYLSSGLAEYLANAAGTVVGTAVILRRRGLRPGRIVLIALLANVLGFCGLLLWSPVSVLLFVRADIRFPVPVIGRHGVIALIVLSVALSVAMLVALRALALAPHAQNALAKRLLGSTRVGGQPVPMRRLLALIPWSAAAWLCGTLAFFVVLIGLHGPVLYKPVMVVGALALAAILGNLAFFVPAGLGVRDGFLITLLVHTTNVPMSAAAVAVIAMRALDPLSKFGLLLALGLGHGLRKTTRYAHKTTSAPNAEQAAAPAASPATASADTQDATRPNAVA